MPAFATPSMLCNVHKKLCAGNNTAKLRPHISKASKQEALHTSNRYPKSNARSCGEVLATPGMSDHACACDWLNQHLPAKQWAPHGYQNQPISARDRTSLTLMSGRIGFAMMCGYDTTVKPLPKLFGCAPSRPPQTQTSRTQRLRPALPRVLSWGGLHHGQTC